MKKLKMIKIALACATILTGCGGENPHEKMVKELYAALQAGDFEKVEKFAEENFDSELQLPEKTKRIFRAVSASDQPVKTEILKTLNKKDSNVSFISAKCADTTLYFVVAAKAGQRGKFLLVSGDNADLAAYLNQQ